MIMFIVRMPGPYAVTKCYLPCVNCTHYNGTFLIFCSMGQN